MSLHFKELNKQRTTAYKKKAKEENFLSELNKHLQQLDKKYYRDTPKENYPTIFIFGLPRAGTTLLSQLISNSFEIGFFNNYMARFWLAPITAIRLNNFNFAKNNSTNFESDYGATKNLSDMHEFGYFWRYWLKIGNADDIINSLKRERTIDWEELKNVLLNIQEEFNKAVVYRNNFGAFHINKFSELLNKIIFIQIERNPLDVAVSILNARKNYFNNLEHWWATVPIEYNRIKNLPYIEQIWGQVYFLKEYYNRQTYNNEKVLKITYKELCDNPLSIIEKIQKHCFRTCRFNLNISNSPPKSFKYREYDNLEKAQFIKVQNKFY